MGTKLSRFWKCQEDRLQVDEEDMKTRWKNNAAILFMPMVIFSCIFIAIGWAHLISEFFKWMFGI